MTAERAVFLWSMKMLVSRIIEMSLKQLGVLAAGESVQGDELADALITLEGLLSQWATKRLYIHKVEQITLSLNGSAKVSPNNTDAPNYKTSISGIVERGLLNGEPVYIVRDTNTTQDDANVTYSVNGEVWTFFES